MPPSEPSKETTAAAPVTTEAPAPAPGPTLSAADSATSNVTTDASTASTSTSSESGAAPAAASEAPKESPSLLSTADAGKREGAEAPKSEPEKSPEPAAKDPAKEGAKPTEAAKPAEPAPAEKAPADGTTEATKTSAETQPPPAPVFDAFKVPEGIALDSKEMDSFTQRLGQFELALHADPANAHAKVQELGQQLIDQYTSEVQRIAKEVNQHQVDVWNRQNETWINEFKSDPQLGGNRQDTTLGNAKYVVEQFGGSKEQQAETLRLLSLSGMGNNIHVIRLLNNVYERFREPEPHPANPEPAQTKQGRADWYGKVDGKAA